IDFMKETTINVKRRFFSNVAKNQKQYVLYCNADLFDIAFSLISSCCASVLFGSNISLRLATIRFNRFPNYPINIECTREKLKNDIKRSFWMIELETSFFLCLFLPL